MPYIKYEDRLKWDKGLSELLLTFGVCGATPGDLNYLMTCLASFYVDLKGLNYTTLNDVKGAFVCASDEFTRRVINPYEDKKIEENGDL